GDAVMHLLDVMNPLLAEQVRLLAQQTLGLLVEALGMSAEYLRGSHRHRAVHVNGYLRQLAGARQLMQEVNDGLRPTDAERGDHHLAAARRRFPYHLPQ